MSRIQQISTLTILDMNSMKHSQIIFPKSGKKKRQNIPESTEVTSKGLTLLVMIFTVFTNACVTDANKATRKKHYVLCSLETIASRFIFSKDSFSSKEYSGIRLPWTRLQ